MEKRVLLAITLSMLIIMVYPYFLAKLYPSLKETPQQENTIIQSMPVQEIRDVRPITSQKIEEKWVKETTNSIISITNMGAHISQVQLNNYKDMFTDNPVELLVNNDGQAGPLSIYIGGNPQVYAYERAQDEYLLKLENGINISKRFEFDEGKYLTYLDLTIKNDSNVAQDIFYNILCSSKLKNDSLDGERLLEAYMLIDDNPRRVGLYNLHSAKTYKGKIEWVAQKNKYFCIILKPLEAYFPSANPTKITGQSVFINPLNSKELQICLGMASVRIEPNSEAGYRFLLYAGPSDYYILKSIKDGKLQKITGLNNISLLLLDILRFFYKIVHNYGVSIILLTLLISAVLYPFTLKSLKSMQKIQELQPKIDSLRIEYKNNPQRLNKELLEIYKKHKVNPLGGCLPMLFQMPVFFALYQTLSRAFELRQAGFLWIKDLSSPDRAFHLPFSLPVLGDFLNILPILMAFAMAFQQRISQTSTASVQPEQKMLMSIMPIMFGFIFYNLPSGLVLYWLTNTIIMIVCYRFIKKPHPTVPRGTLHL